MNSRDEFHKMEFTEEQVAQLLDISVAELRRRVHERGWTTTDGAVTNYGVQEGYMKPGNQD